MWTRLIVCSLCLVLAALYFEREHLGSNPREVMSHQNAPPSRPQIQPETDHQTGPAENPAQMRPSQEQKAQASENPSEVRLSPENRAELEQCGLPAGAEIVTLDDVIRGLTQKAGKAEKQELIWRNIHFRTENGEERRLRIWRENSGGGRKHLKTQLFSLDEEGLPVPIETPSDIKKFLNGKSVQLTQEKIRLNFRDPRHLALTLETQNGRVRSVEAKDDGIDFQCSTAPEASTTDCKCLSNKSSH